jgi:WD40 repeat protein
MAAELGDIPSVVARARIIEAGAEVVGARFLGDTAVFVLGEEFLLFVAADGSDRRIGVHSGAILAVAADAKRIVTGGDDGKVVATEASGVVTGLADDPKHRWIDHVALGPDHAVAWSAGRDAHFKFGNGKTQLVQVASTVGALAFVPKGVRLAIAHYNGVTLWFPNAPEAKPTELEWKGSHLAATFSPDGRFLVTAMQEPMLHGWRLADRKDMRMQGYVARVRSLDWTCDGKELATSGSNQLILWPFQAKDGPMGKSPRLFAPMQTPVTAVACHPKLAIIAVGYADGLILLVRTDDAAEILARKPDRIPVTALGWNRSGTLLAFGTEAGAAGLVDLT